MRKIIYDKFHRIIALLVIVSILIAVVLNSLYSPDAVYADTFVGENEYDSTYVLDDLEGATIKGELFDIKDYAFNSKKDTQVLTFTEYCYSYYSNQQGNYALYVYVWNPQGLDIVTDSTRNKISLRFGSDEEDNYVKYQLYFCSVSSGDYQGLIYKFKVYLSSDAKTEIFETLNSVERVYTVSEIELYTNDASGVTAYYVSTTYTFTGFAAGYGSNTSDASTLSVVEQQADTLTLDNLGIAYYRPEGTNGDDDYTQDNLSSVYFAVPNSYIEKYGYLCGLSAEWYEAMLYPMLVTADEYSYNTVCKYLGQDITSACVSDDDFDRCFVGLNSYSISPSYSLYCNYSYGMFPSSSDSSPSFAIADNSIIASNVSYYENDYWLNKLYSVFLKEDYVQESGLEVVSTSEIITALESATKKAYSSYDKVAEEYASYLFDWYNTEATPFKVDMRENKDGYDNAYLDLTSQTVSYDNWWKKLWGDETVTTTTFDGISALQALSDDDFDSAYSDSYNAQSLFVCEEDYSDLKSYYEEWSTKTSYTDASGMTYDTDGYTIYLCRFDVGIYKSHSANLFRKGTYLGDLCWYLTDSNTYNNYFFQETVYLGFDIIDVTLTNGKTDTVLGVVNTPIDVIYESTSPVNAGDGDDCSGISWELVIGIVLLVVLLIVCAPLLPYVAKFIVWLVSLPFKLIAAICRGISKSSKESKERKRQKDNENRKE